MASSLQTLALKLHIKGEKHDDFRRLCSYHLRAATPDGQTINATIIDTACVKLLDEHGPAIWPMFQPARKHLLDTAGDKSWKANKKQKSVISLITGPRFFTDGRPAPKETGPFERLSSRLGKVVRQYFEALAAEPTLWNGFEDGDAETLLSNILAIEPTKNESTDNLTNETASELWLRDAQALKSLALHHLCKIMPDVVGQGSCSEQLSEHESRVEEAVVSFLDAHGATLWPRPAQQRRHLQTSIKRSKARSFSQGFYASTSQYWGKEQGPVFVLHGRMPTLTVERWKARFGGRKPCAREQVAHSKIGAILKTYFNDLLRTGQKGKELDDICLSGLLGRLGVDDAEPAGNQDTTTASNPGSAAVIDISDDDETLLDTMETDDYRYESNTYVDTFGPPPPNYVPADQPSDLINTAPHSTFDHEAFEQAFADWRSEPTAQGIDLSPAQPTITDNNALAARADSIFSSSFDHIGAFRCLVEGCYHQVFGCTTQEELTMHYGLFHGERSDALR